VTRFLLDTNIISDATKPQPSEALAAWLAAQLDADLYISTLTLAEIRRGILQMPHGRKRRALQRWHDGPEGPRAIFSGRILSFDEAAADAWADVMAEGVRIGAPRSALDMIVAAIALASGCVVVTDNERHFAGVVPLLNPVRR
jgi:predicted nucleic acid-binding protein